MKRVRIVGGPSPIDMKITLEPEGIDITQHVLGFELIPSTKNLLRVTLQCFVELNLSAEVTEIRPGDQETP